MQNIFKTLNKLHTPEWLKIINPIGLVDRILSCFKFLVSPMSLFRAQPFKYSQSIQRKGYALLTWTSDNVQNTTNLMIAGAATFQKTYPYRVYSKQEFEILGCGYTNNIAIKNIDYIYQDGYYWFKEDPSKFCYVYKEEDVTKYYTVAFCSSYNKLIKSYAPTSDIESAPAKVQMYDNLVTNGLYGISNALFLRDRGIITNNGLHGNVTLLWKEKNYTFVITDTGNFIAIPDISYVPVQIGRPLNISYLNIKLFS